jgi:tRNA threonylcarbamoyladenosine biosynthesis protein TsaB
VKILAFESSTKTGSVALIEDGICRFKKVSLIQKSHSEVLHQFVFEILKESDLKLQDIDCCAAGNGPGSFTGIRVSLNTAKGFSYAFSKPMVVIDSLQNLANLNKGLAQKIYATKGQDHKILCLINAYKNMSYYAIYDIGLGSQTKVLVEPRVILMKEIESLLANPILTVGDGYQTYEKFLPEKIRSQMLRPDGIFDDPTAESLGLLAYQNIQTGLTLDWKSTMPLYIRSSEAEETKRGIVWTSLDFKE